MPASTGTLPITATFGDLSGTVDYTYNADRTVTVTAISPNTASPITKSYITITGTNFGIERSLIKV